jgi:hypothetical protein
MSRAHTFATRKSLVSGPKSLRLRRIREGTVPGEQRKRPKEARMLRTPNSRGRRRPLRSTTFATFALVAAFVIVMALGSGSPVAAQGQEKPANTSPPTISGTPLEGNRLQADPGTWTGTQPITFRYRWLRCNTSGGNCNEISGATDDDYVVRTSDVGKTLRVRVNARNDAGATSALSAATSVVKEAPPPAPSGRIQLPGGEISIAAPSIPKEERMIVSQVRFEPSVVTTRDPITIRVRVSDTRGFFVRDATVFVRATPRVTTGDRRTTATDGWVVFQLQPLATFPLRRGAVQFFVKAYRSGDPALGGVAGYRLVQVRTAPAT